jgi:hypothetical protein
MTPWLTMVRKASALRGRATVDPFPLALTSIAYSKDEYKSSNISLSVSWSHIYGAIHGLRILGVALAVAAAPWLA